MTAPRRIVADDAIPHLAEAFGEVTRVRGADITAAHLRDADALLVRSVTRVDDALLDGSSVSFVASATAGVDHIDQAALRRRGITFAHAPGCNARAVVEYVLAATLHELRGPVGVVGYGQIGRRLTTALRRLGYEVLVCDPPRAEVGCTAETYQPLDVLLERCATVTFHVPKVVTGPHATRHLLTAAGLDRLRPGALVINTCRGEVVDNAALEDWLAAERGAAILDVWEHEPQLRWTLLSRCRLATPHIAGYTHEGKARGTAMVHAAAMRAWGEPIGFWADDVLPVATALPANASQAEVLQHVHPLAETDATLRALLEQPEPARASAFEALRRGYTFRRELSAFPVVTGAQPLWDALDGL